MLTWDDETPELREFQKRIDRRLKETQAGRGRLTLPDRVALAVVGGLILLAFLVRVVG